MNLLDLYSCLLLSPLQNRSVTHKKVSVQISLISLVGYECSHPALKPAIDAMASVSWTGNVGALMATDKANECLNKVIEDRRGAHSAFQVNP